MDIFKILQLIGGLSLFLYGMSAMGSGLSKMAGGKLETVLEQMTSKRLYAVLLGTGVTAVIQSSSATTVMVVGFVNSGIMKLNQAVGIIMGANIGTTMTAWILSLTGIQGTSFWLKLMKPSSFSPVLAAIGVIMLMSGKAGSKKQDIGNILIGFAILMFGMETMSGSVAGLANNPDFAGLLTAFSNPVLGMAAGAILTAIIQSSSASVGILQALCITGLVDYSAAIPIIMGQNIGTCVTSLIAAIGACTNAKRAAMIHLYFNLIGTAAFMIVFYSVNSFMQFAFLSDAANAAGIAAVHSFFNVVTTLWLFPFSHQLVKLAEWTIATPADEQQTEQQVSIDERFLDNPAFAMELCRGKVKEMAEVSGRAIALAMGLLQQYDAAQAAEVEQLENLADKYEDVLGSYLVKLSGKDLSEEDSQSMSMILHSISDFERISDHALNVVEAVEEMRAKKLAFSPQAERELHTLCSAVQDVCALTVQSFCSQDKMAATRVEPLEQVIDDLTRQIKANHVTRLQAGGCSMESGLVLEDLLIGLERVSDHCSNIAVEMITIYQNDYHTHAYFKNFTAVEQQAFRIAYKKLSEKYALG